MTFKFPWTVILWRDGCPEASSKAKAVVLTLIWYEPWMSPEKMNRTWMNGIATSTVISNVFIHNKRKNEDDKEKEMTSENRDEPWNAGPCGSSIWRKRKQPCKAIILHLDALSTGTLKTREHFSQQPELRVHQWVGQTLMFCPLGH